VIVGRHVTSKVVLVRTTTLSATVALHTNQVVAGTPGFMAAPPGASGTTQVALDSVHRKAGRASYKVGGAWRMEVRDALGSAPRPVLPAVAVPVKNYGPRSRSVSWG
jgi:hypothetical protein